MGKSAGYNIWAKVNGAPFRKFKPSDPASTYAISIGSEFAISRISGLDLFGYSASKLKKIIKMKISEGDRWCISCGEGVF